MASAETYRDIFQVIRKTEQDSLDWDMDTLKLEAGCQRLLFLNAHAINTAASNPEFRRSLLESDYLLRDGIGLEMALRFLDLRKTENLNGTDLIPKILDRFRMRKIAVWGSSEEALEKLRQRLESEGYTDLTAMQHGFHDDAFYINEYQKTRPEILVLCMGMPRQEILARKLRDTGHGCLIICGGGWANFHSGHIKRAPAFLRRNKLEWLHRLAKEPLRVGKRYTIGVFYYFVYIYLARKYRNN